MEGEVLFKKGSDLDPAARSAASETLTCESCGCRVEAVAASESGWQVRPPVCPDCLRWAVAEVRSRFRIEKHGRFWAVMDGETLICVTVYRRGADAVLCRLAGEEERHGRV